LTKLNGQTQKQSNLNKQHLSCQRHLPIQSIGKQKHQMSKSAGEVMTSIQNAQKNLSKNLFNKVFFLFNKHVQL
jgi:hypothetical protein